MDTKVYWVGEKPGGSITITVLDEVTGLPASLAGFSSARLRMLDSRNNEVYIEEGRTQIANAAEGRVVFAWPEGRSVFTEPGEYVLQLELLSGVAQRYTTVQNILVKEFGGVTR